MTDFEYSGLNHGHGLENWQEQVRGIIIAIAGNSTTVGKSGDKEVAHLFYHELQSYLKSKRFNTDFKDELIRRKNDFQPRFFVEPLDDFMERQLSVMFPVDMESHKIHKLWKEFGEIKTNCRTDWGPLYQRSWLDVAKSGDYNDLEVLQEILRKSVIERINENEG